MIFLIAMLAFGPKKIGGLGKGLGAAIRDFRAFFVRSRKQEDVPLN